MPWKECSVMDPRSMAARETFDRFTQVVSRRHRFGESNLGSLRWWAEPATPQARPEPSSLLFKHKFSFFLPLLNDNGPQGRRGRDALFLPPARL
jgi:hypothetical protein